MSFCESECGGGVWRPRPCRVAGRFEFADAIPSSPGMATVLGGSEGRSSKEDLEQDTSLAVEVFAIGSS